jgi:hypothetical protein
MVMELPVELCVLEAPELDVPAECDPDVLVACSLDVAVAAEAPVLALSDGVEPLARVELAATPEVLADAERVPVSLAPAEEWEVLDGESAPQARTVTAATTHAPDIARLIFMSRLLEAARRSVPE